MKKVIWAIAYELWVAIQQHKTTFNWEDNWFYFRKTQDLEAMLKQAIDLQDKEQK